MILLDDDQGVAVEGKHKLKNSELAAALKKREALKKQYKEYTVLEEYIKTMAKSYKEETGYRHFICGDYEIMVVSTEYTQYLVPTEIKKDYATICHYDKVAIEKLQKKVKKETKKKTKKEKKESAE
jgi:hypothetical protein